MNVAKKNEVIENSFCTIHKSIKDSAWENSIKTVVLMNLPIEIKLPREINFLSHRANYDFCNCYEVLQGSFRDEIYKLFAYAQWVKWLACWYGFYWEEYSFENELNKDDNYQLIYSKAIDYAKTEGWASSVLDLLSEYDFDELIKDVIEKFEFKNKPKNWEILQAMQLHWLWEAGNTSSRYELTAALHEAGQADTFANGFFMWEEGRKALIEEIQADPSNKVVVSTKSMLAKVAAKARHASTHVVREQVVKRYTAEQAIYASKDAAAWAFTKDYPFEFTTIRSWLRNK